jgi:hypothetical protein
MKIVWRLVLSACVFPFVTSANLLSNASFEVPAATTDFGSSGWTAYGTSVPGRDWWATRTGGAVTNKGGFLAGWSGANNGGVYQDVAVSAGTHTFSIWVRHEEGYNALTDKVRIEWYDADTNILQESVATFTDVPSDDFWHHLYVSDTCSSQDLSFARAIYEAEWGVAGSGGTGSMFDDADFYAGAHAGTPLSNRSFERPTSDADGYWRASQWHNVPEGAYSFESWANRSGSWGVGLWGWEVAAESNSVEFFQHVVPGTGTYSFAVHMNREADYYLSNATLRLQWFDRTFTNKVMADTFTNVTVPNSGTWNEYVVSGSCASTDLYEVRATLFIEWWENANPGGGKGFKIDDARFLPGLYTGTSLTEDWSYHQAPGYTPSLETVPGTNVGAFLQVDYTSKTSTFYVLTPADGFAIYEGEGSQAGMRTSWQRPENGHL